MKAQASLARKIIEGIIVNIRWIQLPIYIAILAIMPLFALAICKEVVEMYRDIAHLDEAKLIIHSLEMCDAVLITNLLFMVVISGYGNFISSFTSIKADRAIPIWLRKLSHSDVKVKIANSLVAISSIQLLKQFIDIPNQSDHNLIWYISMHIAFLISSLVVYYTAKHRNIDT